MFTGINPHVHGHKFRMSLADLTIYVVTLLYYKTGKIDYIAFFRRENALKIIKETL